MFLIVVADIDLGTKIYRTGVRLYYSVYELKYGSLASSVITDKGNAFTTLYVNVNIVKECYAVKAFGKFPDSQNIITADYVRSSFIFILSFNS